LHPLLWTEVSMQNFGWGGSKRIDRVRQENSIGADGVSWSGCTGGGSCQYNMVVL